ncbi:MAG: hypothetical protein V1729_04640 [Candidatus Woesearchaeota archaeon]
MRLQLVIAVIAICLLAIIGALFYDSERINELTGSMVSIPSSATGSTSMLNIAPAILFLAVILIVYCTHHSSRGCC